MQYLGVPLVAQLVYGLNRNNGLECTQTLK